MRRKVNMLEPILCSMLLLAIGTGLEAQVKHPTDYESKWRSGENPRNSTKLEQIGEIHPALPRTKLLSAAESYFEVDDDGKAGDEVIGRVNLANNSFEKAHFSITGGTGKELFSIEDYANSRGKCFGVLKLKTSELPEDSYLLKVKAEFEDGISNEQEYTIHKVDELMAERFLKIKEKEFSRHRRLFSHAPDNEIEDFLSKIALDGSFEDLPYAMGKEGWENTCNSAERLLKFAVAYLDKDSRFHEDEKLKKALYRGIIRNAQQNNKFRTNWADTHVWRNSDFIAGIGIRFFRILREEMNSDKPAVSKAATEVYDAILDVCDVMWAERMHERPAVCNANRNHRMRSLTVRAAISYDYNRALTDQNVWYDTVDPRIAGYYPNGAFGDVMELIETNYIFRDTYGNRNGFFPDGTICHHPAVGIQFTADGYGWPWLVENSIPMANFLKNTPYRAKNSTYDIIADELLDAYRPLTYNGCLDMPVGGLLTDRSKWGPRLLEAITGLIEAKSNDTIIKREKELLEYKSILENNNFVDELTLNQPFWNIDYIIHRRPDYFASAKMISTRSRGLERGVEKRSYYYLGDGALFIRVNKDDYNGLSNVINWHAIPGTTAEQRKDKLPLDARSAFPGAPGTNTFAGVVSDGQYGFGAFIYERNHADDAVNYSTVNARKSYFFFEKEIVAVGNSVKRVRPGDGMDIWTTLNQIAWNGKITYQVNGNRIESVPEGGTDIKRKFTIDHSVAWFHHDNVGYVIVPTGKPIRIELFAGKRVGVKKGKKAAGIGMFQLAINHGPDPTNDEYRYIILPDVTADDVERFEQNVDLSANVQILANNKDIVAVRHNALGITQAAFYEAGSITAPFGKGENICLTVDRPALVMLCEDDDKLKITVTDPKHSISELTTNIDINRKLSGPNAHYDAKKKITKIAFKHSPVEVYAGKPISESYTVSQSK